MEDTTGLFAAFVWDAQEILPGLYLGAVDCLYCPDDVAAHNIKACVSILNDCEASFITKEIQQYKLKWVRVALDDDPTKDLEAHFVKTCKFIHKRLKKGEGIQSQ
jgi:hypothetical protein